VGVAHERAGVDRAEPPAYVGLVESRWKYLWYPEGGREQLFDLVDDPYELRDRAAEEPGEAARLRSALCAELRAQGAPASWTSTDGRLVAVPTRDDSTAERRASGWPGLHTEAYPVDVRH